MQFWVSAVSPSLELAPLRAFKVHEVWLGRRSRLNMLEGKYGN